MFTVVAPPTHPAFAALAEAGAAIDELASANLWSLRDDETLELRAQLGALAARLASVTLAATREIDARQAATDTGATSTAAWLRSTLHQHPGAAKREVALAAALDRELAATGQALAAGEITSEQAQVIATAIGRLPTALDAATRARAEQFMLGHTATFDPDALARLGRHLARTLDPEHGAALERDEARRFDRQEFTLVHGLDGARTPRGMFTPEAGALIDAALDAVSAPRPAADGTPDPRSPARRRADGLLELLQIAAGAPEMPEAGGEPVTVVVTTPLAVLEDRLHDAGPEGAVLEDGSPISPESARRLACDAFLIAAVLGTTSEILDIGRLARAVPRPMRRALIARDRGCAFPGCGRPPRWCHAHHIVHWAMGGSTSLQNLVLLCGHHHRVIHHDGWSVHIGEDGLPVFTPPRWIDPDQRPRPAHHTTWLRAVSDIPLRT
jgi:hypothetical protein